MLSAGMQRAVLLVLGYLSFKASHVALVSGKEPASQCRKCERHEFIYWVRKIPRRRVHQPTSVFLPGESHGQRSLAGHTTEAT